MTDSYTPEQLSNEGKKRYEQEYFAEAAKAFAAAADGYRAKGDALNAAEMDNNRSVALLQEGEADAALQAVKGTSELFSEANDPRREAMALGNKAAALAALDKTEEAEKVYWESARILNEMGETEMRASVLQAISKLQFKTGRRMEALASMQSGLNQVKKPNFVQRILRKLIGISQNLLNRS